MRVHDGVTLLSLHAAKEGWLAVIHGKEGERNVDIVHVACLNTAQIERLIVALRSDGMPETVVFWPTNFTYGACKCLSCKRA